MAESQKQVEQLNKLQRLNRKLDQEVELWKSRVKARAGTAFGSYPAIEREEREKEAETAGAAEAEAADTSPGTPRNIDASSSSSAMVDKFTVKARHDIMRKRQRKKQIQEQRERAVHRHR
jgi:hypothetical protein